MPRLYRNAKHRGSIYTPASSQDAGGGTTLTYTLAQSSIPCIINPLSSNERELFAQQGMVVSHVVGICTALLTATPVRGIKFVDAASGASYHVEGIKSGQAYGSIEALTYLYCQEQL